MCTSSPSTYSIAVIAVAGDVTLTTAKVDTGVLLGVAPIIPVAFRHVFDGHFAARNDGVVLSSGKTSKSRNGDDERGVEHGGLLYGAKSINACARKYS